jgi:hypothetical protein
MTTAASLSAEWALSAFDVSPDDFWSEGGDGLVDCGELARLAACAHAEEDFEVLWERCDAHQDVMAILGRMIATTRLEKAFDHPLDRSWHHGLFIDLARLEGALDLELSSERMLRHAVACYWDAMKSFVAGVKEQLDIVGAELGDGDKAREEEAVETAARQLSLF